MILQKRLQSLPIMDNHFFAISSTFVAFVMAFFTCQQKYYGKNCINLFFDNKILSIIAKVALMYLIHANAEMHVHKLPILYCHKKTTNLLMNQK